MRLRCQVWVHVLSYVDVERVVNCVSFVSRGFYALATEPQLWHRLVRRYFPSVVNLYEGDPDGWRKTFIAQASSVPHNPPFDRCRVGRGRLLTAGLPAVRVCRSGLGSACWARWTAASRPSLVLARLDLLAH